MKTQALIIKILEKRLRKEIENILAITKQGFDIYVNCEFFEITFAIKQLLEVETQINPRIFRLITSMESISLDINDDLAFAFIPTVLIGHHKLKDGTGFVRYSIESPDKLLEKVSIAIEEILNSFGLQSYLDCFDAQIFSKLKEIAKIRGISCLIDAVVQTAYLSGFNGNNKAALHYLDTFNISTPIENDALDISIQTCGKRFLSHCITYGDNTVAFLKSSLSHYVVHQQGHTMSRASQILNISRTTLLEHLKIAEKIGVAHFFES